MMHLIRLGATIVRALHEAVVMHDQRSMAMVEFPHAVNAHHRHLHGYPDVPVALLVPPDTDNPREAQRSVEDLLADSGGLRRSTSSATATRRSLRGPRFVVGRGTVG